MSQSDNDEMSQSDNDEMSQSEGRKRQELSPGHEMSLSKSVDEMSQSDNDEMSQSDNDKMSQVIKRIEMAAAQSQSDDEMSQSGDEARSSRDVLITSLYEGEDDSSEISSVISVIEESEVDGTSLKETWSCDKMNSEIKIPAVQEKSCNGEKGKRIFNKRSACLFCGNVYSNISKHYTAVHKKEPKVAEIIALKEGVQGSSEIKQKWELVRHLGNHQHNLKVVAEKKGELMLVRRKKGKTFSIEDYGPCPQYTCNSTAHDIPSTEKEVIHSAKHDISATGKYVPEHGISATEKEVIHSHEHDIPATEKEVTHSHEHNIPATAEEVSHSHEHDIPATEKEVIHSHEHDIPATAEEVSHSHEHDIPATEKEVIHSHEHDIPATEKEVSHSHEHDIPATEKEVSHSHEHDIPATEKEVSHSHEHDIPATAEEVSHSHEHDMPATAEEVSHSPNTPKDLDVHFPKQEVLHVLKSDVFLAPGKETIMPAMEVDFAASPFPLSYDSCTSSDEDYEMDEIESENSSYVSSTESEEVPDQSFQDTQNLANPDSLSTPCSHGTVKEGDIERDATHNGIFIRKVVTSDSTKTGRTKSSNCVWNNYHCCFICKRLSTNIVKHLLTHRDNKEIQGLKTLRDITTKEGQSLSKTTQTLLRNRGDHEHNLTVKKNRKGEMLISRRTVNFHVEDYGPCPYCLEWLKLDSLGSRHQSYCPATKTDGKVKKAEAIVRSTIITGGINDQATPRLVKEVYPVMTQNEITATAKADGLVVALGNNWLRRNLGNKLKRKYYTSSRMRGASRLLEHLRSITQTNKTMSDYVTPEYFDSMCRPALMCAEMENDDEEDLKSPSTAVKISYDVNRMANIKLGLALRTGDNGKKKEAEDFLSLLKLEWTTKVTRMARLKLRSNQISQPCKQLPIPEDLSVLGGRVVEELKNLDTRDKANFRRAQILVQTRLLTYNKRRSGELESLSLENYKMRSKGLDEADHALLGNDLTDLERYLVDSQELIKIRGKNGKIVPILVPDDSIKALEFICSPSLRQSVGVKAWNPYVFANTGDGVIRAYDSLKEICGELHLAAPDRITSVTMRKYIATLSQMIDMKDHKLQWLCNHLGHTVEIHKLHYRSTSGFIERVNIGKLMLLQDLYLAGKYAGKRLQDIDLSEVVTNPPKEEPCTGTVDAGGADQSDSEPVEDIGEDERPVVKRMKNSSSTRVAWSEQEETELRELLADNIKQKRLPRMRECLKAISQSRINNGVLHRRKWETIKKKTLRLINNLKSK